MDENRFYPSLSIVSLAPHFVNRIHNNRSIIQYIRENSYRNKFIFENSVGDRPMHPTSVDPCRVANPLVKTTKISGLVV